MTTTTITPGRGPRMLHFPANPDRCSCGRPAVTTFPGMQPGERVGYCGRANVPVLEPCYDPTCIVGLPDGSHDARWCAERREHRRPIVSAAAHATFCGWRVRTPDDDEPAVSWCAGCGLPVRAEDAAETLPAGRLAELLAPYPVTHATAAQIGASSSAGLARWGRLRPPAHREAAGEQGGGGEMGAGQPSAWTTPRP